MNTDDTVSDLAEALWQMFAYGNEANRWDDKAKARWYPKAERVLQLTEKNRVARETREERDQ